ncbi:iron chelate uptake ABC transporter family permease subunit [Alkalihalobacillus pseudalcaliphilus]|uniref:iron chelate uptake ABC transporter family permease subunit n=1 Tax=Alkalihalobacillus pseudalcaliphilus TaxID=79884 RepID=UPI00064D9E44|nr:iron chelate uptake ABC transporter family permease subunit [Alkalihalobacillus pseudalcaliphilus]KMK76020.1 iron ABC transporter permease [Alkalihalobacillus pseudalcaliphilus]
MGIKTKILLLSLLAVILTGLFLFYDLRSWEYALPRRGIKILSIIVTGVAIAFATVVFQTITNNRILTPSLIGLDSLYQLFQTFIIFSFGSMSVLVLNQYLNFAISTILMVIFAMLLYQLLLRGEGKNIFFLLLVGIIMGTFFGSISTFLQVLIDPNEYLNLQNRLFASFNNVNSDLLLVSIGILIFVTIIFYPQLKYLDVLSLGRDQAINLGVNYDRAVKLLLIFIAILVSLATALVGPITFLGLLVANVAYEVVKTYKHAIIIPVAMLISVIALVGGQLLVERIFSFSTPISVIINFVGGVYFLYLLLRESKKW